MNASDATRKALPRTRAWYVVAWMSMLALPLDIAVANNAAAAVWVRSIFIGLFLVHGFVALWAFRRSGRGGSGA